MGFGLHVVSYQTKVAPTVRQQGKDSRVNKQRLVKGFF